jgi:hypothetical protein
MILIFIYIHDDRYTVPTWRTADIRAEDATALARALIASNDHYRRVDLWLDDQLIALANRTELAHAA